MSWNYVVTENLNALTTEQIQENAIEFYNHFKYTMTLEAICGLLGNIQRESQLNPGQTEYGYDGDPNYGYGFIGWTPGSILTTWASENGYDWYDGEAQCIYIDEENYYTGSAVVWLPTTEYPYTWNEFKGLTDVDEAVKAYLYERERAGVSALDQRLQFAHEWYTFLSGYAPEQYVPRLTSDGMLGNPWWYSNGNVFYAAGYGLPNCTCYAYGRYAEIQGNEYVFPQLPTGDAGTWYDNATALRRGSIPQLGAVACWQTSDPSTGALGHVAIVEQINNDGSIVTSNSGWNAEYFWTETLYPQHQYCSSWMTTPTRKYYLQGFIYNDIISPIPPHPQPVKKRFPFWLLLKY